MEPTKLGFECRCTKYRTKPKVEPLVEVYEVKKVVKPEILEAVDEVIEEDMHRGVIDDECDSDL